MIIIQHLLDIFSGLIGDASSFSHPFGTCVVGDEGLFQRPEFHYVPLEQVRSSKNIRPWIKGVFYIQVIGRFRHELHEALGALIGNSIFDKRTFRMNNSSDKFRWKIINTCGPMD